MIQRDPLRQWISSNLQPIAFLFAYFATIVAGNLIFASPLGELSLKATGFSPRILEMDQIFTFGYWSLLLCPFVVTPIVVYATRRTAGPLVAQISNIFREFNRTEYLVFLIGCYAVVLYKFWQADVAALFLSGTDALSSVNARFEIHDRIGYWTLMVLQALLPFLSIYSLIRWMRSRERFWLATMVVNVFAMSVLLTMLNMKWPVLLFYTALVMALFVHAKRRAYLKAVAGAAFLVVAFLLISTVVFRIAPATQTAKPQAVAVEPVLTGHHSAAKPGAAESGETDAAEAGRVVAERVVATSEAAIGYAPSLLFAALNRMAVVYPYYYQTFTTEGAVCGGILDQARRGPTCRPSTLIYSRIFGSAEGYSGKGTSPSSVHVSGYALGGWPTALAMLFCGSVLLGLFSSLPIDRNVTISALAIVGALAGYHLSQVPAEGVILFDHGLLWTFLMLAIFLGWRLTRTIAMRSTRAAQQPAE